jgi:cobalt/nickel transport system ATP-binding protein
MLARTDLLVQAGLRLPWGIAVTRLLRERGLLTGDAPGPRTPDELAALVGAAPPVPADG